MNCAHDERLGGPDPCGRMTGPGPMPDMRRLSWLMGEGSAVEHGPVGAPGEGVGGRGYLWAWTALSIG